MTEYIHSSKDAGVSENPSEQQMLNNTQSIVHCAINSQIAQITYKWSTGLK